MARIEVSHLKYRYPNSKDLVLNDISFTIESGEFIGVIGKNGAGKSSLCQAIVGLIPHFYRGAYGGYIKIDGIEVKNANVDDLVSKVGIVFQNPFNQITGAKMTVYKEIAFGLENIGIPREEMKMRIQEAMEILDIAKYKDRNPFELSGGQMQRMQIASIIAMRPEVLILDEPTSQLDPQGSEEVFQAVQKLGKQGITIIMVEHKMEKLAVYSDRILLLNQGKQIDFDSPSNIFSRQDLLDQGVNPPIYTTVCKGLGRKMEDGTYPVTIEQCKELLQKLPNKDLKDKGAEYE